MPFPSRIRFANPGVLPVVIGKAVQQSFPPVRCDFEDRSHPLNTAIIRSAVKIAGRVANQGGEGICPVRLASKGVKDRIRRALCRSRHHRWPDQRRGSDYQRCYRRRPRCPPRPFTNWLCVLHRISSLAPLYHDLPYTRRQRDKAVLHGLPTRAQRSAGRISLATVGWRRHCSVCRRQPPDQDKRVAQSLCLSNSAALE